MAETTASARVNGLLTNAQGAVDNLRYDAEYYKQPGRDNTAPAMEWSNDLGLFRVLARDFSEMTAVQKERYLAALQSLREAEPYLRQLDWEVPEAELFRVLDEGVA